MASEPKMKVVKTEKMIQLNDWNVINRPPSQCNRLNLSSHQGRQTQEHTLHQQRQDTGGTPCFSE
jgi:hypothetical protein